MRLADLRAVYDRGEASKLDYFRKMQGEHARLLDYAEFIKNTGIRAIKITDGRTVFVSREHGIEIECDPRDMGTPAIVSFNLGAYEKDDGSVLMGLVDDGMAFFDVGANLGWYGLHVAKLLPNCRVFAFEPVPTTFAYLARNVAANSLTNMRAFNFGLFVEQAERMFFVDPFSGGAASTSEQATMAGEPQRCIVRKLDDVVEELGVLPDFIKADVEGAELFVFQGGINAIERARPVIFAEMLRKHSATFNYHPNDIIKLLADVGYRCFTRAGKRLKDFFQMDEETVETNFVFLHPEKHQAKIAQWT